MTALPSDAPRAGREGQSSRAVHAQPEHLRLVPPLELELAEELETPRAVVVPLSYSCPGPCPFQRSRRGQALKRLIDLLLSLTMLVGGSPLMLALAIAIKLDSPGPVFYLQERVGMGGRRFKLLKFRSMRVDAEAATGPVFATRDDPRTTRVGRLMRRYSLDELPQFINVLRGEMSVVGPRPERPHFVRQFSQTIPAYPERHAMKAGITGWAQVNDLRGATSIEERTRHDLTYIAAWSLWLDVKIMLLTVRQIVRAQNAY